MSENEMGTAKSSRTPLLLLVLVIVIAAAAAAYFFLIQPGQTPVDTEALVLNIDELVLQPKDLPGNYATEYNTHFSNEQLTSALGAAEAKTYALETGRVDGWQVYYRRAGAGQLVPEFYFNRTEVFESTQGASQALSEDFFWVYTDDEKAPDEWLDRSCSYGQECILFSYREVKAGAGAATVRTDMAFRYKNLLVWLYVKGQEGEATEQHLFDAAELLIDRIDSLN
jgi:hypothetical protein